MYFPYSTLSNLLYSLSPLVCTTILRLSRTLSCNASSISSFVLLKTKWRCPRVSRTTSSWALVGHCSPVWHLQQLQVVQDDVEYYEISRSILWMFWGSWSETHIFKFSQKVTMGRVKWLWKKQRRERERERVRASKHKKLGTGLHRHR